MRLGHSHELLLKPKKTVVLTIDRGLPFLVRGPPAPGPLANVADVVLKARVIPNHGSEVKDLSGLWDGQRGKVA